VERLFGTDGIRDVAGRGRLAPGVVHRLGRALGRLAAPAAKRAAVLVARDPRASGPALTSLLAGGLQSEGVNVHDASVLPTPALAWSTRQGAYALGVMVSASHNPPEDNGIKVFAASGEKLGPTEEERLEAAVAAIEDEDAPSPEGALIAAPERADAYVEELLHHRFDGLQLEGRKIVVDGANGAAHRLAPLVLRALGAEVHPIACDPDGHNINVGAGATHPEHLREAVVAERADLGIALDGDGDRVILVDETGAVRDGDEILWILATHLAGRGELRDSCVAATVMSNVGLEVALRERGIRLLRAPVGDRHVAEAMRAHGLVLGGEQSGHVIVDVEGFLSGDGLAAALHVLRVLAETGVPLSRAAGRLRRFPQVLLNVRVRNKPPLEELDGVRDALVEARRELGDEGRVLLRYSGTEPLARVMVEGPDAARTTELARRIARVVEERIGAAAV